MQNTRQKQCTTSTCCTAAPACAACVGKACKGHAPVPIRMCTPSPSPVYILAPPCCQVAAAAAPAASVSCTNRCSSGTTFADTRGNLHNSSRGPHVRGTCAWTSTRWVRYSTHQQAQGSSEAEPWQKLGGQQYNAQLMMGTACSASAASVLCAGALPALQVCTQCRHL
jgi:hypothetical protein